MADRRGLRMIGFLYGGFTALVMGMACLVVTDHLTGRLSLDTTAPKAIEISAVR